MKTRSQKLLTNVSIGMISYVVITIIGLFTRRVLVNTVGLGINGINGAFMSIVSMLSLTELGIGPAIVFHLYKPLATGDKKTVISLMQVYGKIYRIFSVVILALGVCILPFLSFFVKEDFDYSFLAIVFILMILDTVISYLFSYKRAIINADQKVYIVTIITTLYNVLLNSVKIAILLITKDYILFLVSSIIFRFLENFTISILADKMYPYIKSKEKISLSPEIKRSIISTVKAVSLHYIGMYLINGCDNIVISAVIGTGVAGIYVNYSLIITTFKQFLSQALTQGILPTFGHMLVDTDKKESQNVFQKTLFANFAIVNFISISLFVCFNSFVRVWLNDSSLLSLPVVFVIVLNFYLEGISETLGSIRAGAGLFSPDRWLHIFLAGLNLAISIWLANSIGIIGVFIGTFVCYTIKNIIVLPNIVYENIFCMSVVNYYKKLFLYIGSTFVFGITTYCISNLFNFEIPIQDLIMKICLCIIIPNLLLFVCYFKTNEFKYCFNIIKNIRKRGS